MPRYFEDLEAGDSYALEGRYEVDREEITAFTEQYDPQPFHLEEAAAADSVFGGLIASGWHTAAMCMRLVVEEFLDPETSMGARGLDSLEWLQPVRPGDTLRVRIEVLETRPSESRPEMGHVRSKLIGYNQDDEAVIEWVSDGMVRRRNPGE